MHNHPSGDATPSNKDIEIVEKISQAGQIMGISVIDFVIVSEKGDYSFYEKLKTKQRFDYVADGMQGTLFDLLETTKILME